MKKIIIKTALITLASIIGAILLTYLMIALISPKTMAEGYGKLGNYKLSVKYYEKQYNKTEEISDLYVLVTAIDEKQDYTKAQEYTAELISHPNFDKFCKIQDGVLNADGEEIVNPPEKTDGVTTKEFVYGKRAVALAKNDFSFAIEFCLSYCEEAGYTSYNPFRIIIIELKGELTSAQKEELEIEMRSYQAGVEDAETRLIIDEDLIFLHS